MRFTIALLATLLALPAVLAVTTTTDITNLPPVVAPGSLSGLAGTTLNPTAGAATSTTVTFTVTDGNGYQDIRWVNVTVLKPDGTVHRAAAPATLSSGSLLAATYTYTFSMNFHDPAALDANLYKVDVSAKDTAGATTLATSVATFNYAELAAVSTAGSVSFGGALAPGATSSTQSLLLTNTGNVRLDAQVSGGALTHSTLAASLPAGSLQWSTASDMTGPTAMTGSAVTANAFDLSAGASSTRNLYLALAVPEASGQWVPQGTYSGTITVGAVKG